MSSATVELAAQAAGGGAVGVGGAHHRRLVPEAQAAALPDPDEKYDFVHGCFPFCRSGGGRVTRRWPLPENWSVRGHHFVR